MVCPSMVLGTQAGSAPLKLGNPPVVEAWVEFRFAVSEEIPPWDEALAESFFDRAFEGRYRLDGYRAATEFVLESTGGRPSIRDAKLILDRVRATRTDTEDRYLQLGRGVLICNFIRKQQSWPDFPVLRDEALDACLKYCQFFKPKKLLAVAINYRDVVTIPWSGEGQVDIKDYVTLYPEVPPATFGRVGDFRMSCSLETAANNGLLTLSMRSERQPVRAGQDSFAIGLRIRMDWNVTSTELESMDTEVIRGWMMEAHKDLLRVFRSAFTETGWNLFAPEKEA